MNEVKIKITSRAMSKAAQEWLFSQGYSWLNRPNQKECWEPNFGGELCYLYGTKGGDIDWDGPSGEELFKNDSSEEVHVETEYKFSRVITVAGKRYRAEDVEKALKYAQELN